MSLSMPCLPNSFQSRIHFLPAVYHHNWFLPLTASAPALSEMTVQDVLETQSLQLLERSCENFAPIQNNKKRLIISILGLFFGRDTQEKSGPWDLLNRQLVRLKGIFIYALPREQLSVSGLSVSFWQKAHFEQCTSACTLVLLSVSQLWHEFNILWCVIPPCYQPHRHCCCALLLLHSRFRNTTQVPKPRADSAAALRCRTRLLRPRGHAGSSHPARHNLPGSLKTNCRWKYWKEEKKQQTTMNKGGRF